MPTPDDSPVAGQILPDDPSRYWSTLELADGLLKAHAEMVRHRFEFDRISEALEARSGVRALVRSGMVILPAYRLVLEAEDLDAEEADDEADRALMSALELARSGHPDGLRRLTGFVAAARDVVVSTHEASSMAEEIARSDFNGCLEELYDRVEELASQPPYTPDPRD